MPSFSDTLVERLAAASSVAVLTGAGMSAESGIATFRDPGGLWDRFKPEELANVRAFLDNPTLVQAWYAHRQEIIRSTEPHAGHRALAKLERLVPRFRLITQNVDGLHQQAGNEAVTELHGNILRAYCVDCKAPAEESHLTPDRESDEPEPVRCAACGGLVRPDVVWFGEALPPGAVEKAEAAAAHCEVLLSVGTSAVVYPAAGIPVLAKAQGAYVAEINIEPSAIAGELDETVIGKAGEVLPELVEAVRNVGSH